MNKNKNEKRISFITIVLCLILLPCLGVLITIGFNSNYLITKFFHRCLIGVSCIIVPIFGYSIYLYFRNRKASNRLKTIKRVILSIFLSLYVVVDA